jgi:hypothetical protein
VDIEGVLAIIFLFGGGTLVGVSFSPLGRAIADRLRYGKVPPMAPEVDPAIYDELDQLRTEMSELNERVDFAERLLSKGPAETPAPDGGV